MKELLIANMKQFIKLSEDEELVVCDLFKEKRLQKNAYFLQVGNTCKEVGFVVRGLLRYYRVENGEEKNYYFASENAYVSNYSSFLPRQPSNQSIQALEDTILLTISFEGLQRFYKQIKEGERFGRKVIEQVFIDTLQQLQSFYIDSPKDRYLQLMKSYPDLLQRISQYHIASYVGVKPQSLSRIRKRI